MNATNKDEKTALNLAVESGYEAVVDRFLSLEDRVDINRQNTDKWRCFMQSNTAVKRLSR